MHIPRHLAEQLLIDSASFRAYVLDTIPTQEGELFTRKIESFIGSFPPSHKIAAIKALRDFSRCTLSEFEQFYQATSNNGIMISLHDAKRIVEKYHPFVQ